MPNKNINDLLNDPKVKQAIDNDSIETIKRRQFIPLLCNDFKYKYTTIKTADNNFFIDPEAKKQLPDLIDNKVSEISGIDSCESSFEENYYKKRKIGIVFSGGPAPGGHNVIAGLYDAAKKANAQSQIFGFLMGPDGIIENEALELTDERVNKFRNLGGFTMINTGRTKIDTPDKMSLSKKTCKDLGLDALIIVGGDDSNTNAAFLAQDMIEDGVQVIGVPKTIDGDVQVRDADGNILCAMSFGFHSAARSFAQQVSHLCTDGSSDVKYWHVCKVMGRVASHLALEVALQSHASMTLIGEDIVNYVDINKEKQAEKDGIFAFDAYGITLKQLAQVVGDAVIKRAACGKNYGVLVVPEGILEFVNEMQTFIIKLNSIIAAYNDSHDVDFHKALPTLAEKQEHLLNIAQKSQENGEISIWNFKDHERFTKIPEFFQNDLLRERDSHGNFPFSLVETEKVLIGLVEEYLSEMTKKGEYRLGIKKDYFEKVLKMDNLDPDIYGEIIFEDYNTNRLILKKSITSKEILLKKLTASLDLDNKIPPAIEKIYKKSMPNFKTQLHFYGYDGRGSNPTRFDCTYTYNLGYTVFSLIANNVTGQMAAIKNIEKDFSQWQPLGIPLAPLMHLEERKGKLSLVMEKSIIDVNSPAFQVVKALREKWLAAHEGDDCFRKPAPIRFDGETEEDRPITLLLNSKYD